MSTKDVLEFAITLPEQEREDLAFEILNSLPAGIPPRQRIEEDLVATIQRRMEDLESGEAKTVELPEAMRRIRGR
ncbi:MAG: addiction module protein [Pirellulaceae bacterium]|nr:addiction module protein [Pirellulaceae bacterium]